MERLAQKSRGRVTFRDLRREVYAPRKTGFLSRAARPRRPAWVSRGRTGDQEPPRAHLDRAHPFGVNDYSADVTRSNHQPGSHRYLVSQSVLEADLVINLPKWKSHGKAGMTGALKNLVGINGDKAYLPHFRIGAPRWGATNTRTRAAALLAQTTLRGAAQKRSRLPTGCSSPVGRC